MTRKGLWAAASLGAAIGAVSLAAAQDQAAADGAAVAASSFQIEAFGGGDESGGLYGGGASLTLPLGSRLGLQIDGIVGKAASETGFYGGAAQLFFRQPESHLIGLSVTALQVDDASQFGVSVIGEYYLDQVTIEALAGIQSGDIVDGGFGGRLGLAYYASPNLRVAGGFSYTEASELGGDLSVEYLVAPASGLSLYAAGGFDNGGSVGMLGLRLYTGAPDQAPAAGDGAAAEGPSLIYRHRNMGRPNSFVASPGTGLRLITAAAGAMKNGTAFGGIEAAPAPATGGGLLSGASADNPASALTDLLGNLLSTEGEQAPLGNLLAGILPAGSTGTPLDGVPVLGDLLGSLTEILSPETLRIGDLPTGDNSVAALPLVGDLVSLLPAEPVLYLLGAAKPDQLLGMLVPSLLQGLGDPAVMQALGGRLTETLTGLLTGTGGPALLPLTAFAP
ncbi:hypothetical protein [Zavarzinia compransoris]|uniref:Uncharacterized protein n=1 Tax=Zavarzinia compransoris TaxID=1264899 RepID=A0A317DYC3_9PROT|nr:hypothetical protein [Zavarzinia compransoris]PWR19669.1 hypothetical protein DKG75_14465 [Zavarzinia compransoris]TDP43387.1 hypothetical protein DES42_11288 [Zavarzinia compransoris]